MRFLVTGVKGQLGSALLRELARRGYEDVIGIDVEDLDITDEKAVHVYIEEKKPDVVFNPAAWTAVDKAELFPEKVRQINAFGPKYIAEACAKIGAKTVQISTDYVFPGTGEKPYEVNDPIGPSSVYGSTKAEGEEGVRKANPKHFVVRISWAFGSGPNFVRTMLRLAETHDKLTVVGDQIGSPTYMEDLARLLVDMALTEEYGTYHATNEGFCSWAEFATEIFRQAGKQVEVEAVTSEEYLRRNPNQARRPLNSRLSKQALIDHGFKPLPSWQDALTRYLQSLKEEQQ